jgi:hypothetical protein
MAEQGHCAESFRLEWVWLAYQAAVSSVEGTAACEHGIVLGTAGQIALNQQHMANLSKAGVASVCFIN